VLADGHGGRGLQKIPKKSRGRGLLQSFFYANRPGFSRAGRSIEQQMGQLVVSNEGPAKIIYIETKWMKFSRVVRASDCQCLGLIPATSDTVLNTVQYMKTQKLQ
jgi:hypothetical protein